MKAGRFVHGLLSVCIPIIMQGCHSNNDSGTEPHVLDNSQSSLTVFGCYPNSFRDTTFIAYEINGASAEGIDCRIYAADGSLVQKYSLSAQDSSQSRFFRTRSRAFEMGFSECVWIADSSSTTIPDGIYYVSLSIHSGDNSTTVYTNCMRKRS